MTTLGLPAPYWRLWSATTLANLGDGVREAAMPLVAAAITRDPLLVAGVTVAQRLPWLVVGLPAGVLLDRADPRTVAAVANWIRAVSLAVLAAGLAAGVAPIWLLLVVVVVVGAGEIVADSVAVVAVPALVAQPHLQRANGFLTSGQIVTNEFLGPPLGGALFLIGAAVPVVTDAGLLAIAGALLLSLPAAVAGRPQPPSPAPAARRTVRSDIRDGVRVVWRDHSLRRLALTTALLAAVDSAWFALLVLFVGDALQLDDAVFGLLHHLDGQPRTRASARLPPIGCGRCGPVSGSPPHWRSRLPLRSRSASRAPSSWWRSRWPSPAVPSRCSTWPRSPRASGSRHRAHSGG